MKIRDNLAPNEIRTTVSRKGLARARREAEASYRLRGMLHQQLKELKEQNRARRAARQ